MKIGMFLTSYFPDRCGGAEQQCRRLSEELVRQGHAVTVFTTRAKGSSPRHAVENGVEVVRLARLEAWGKRGQPSVDASASTKSGTAVPVPAPRWAGIRQRAADVLYALNVWTFLVGSVLFMWRRRNSIDVWHVHVAGLTAGWCGFWARRLGLASVCKGANLPVFPPEPRMPLKRWLGRERRQMNFIALTPEMKDDLVANGVSADRVAVIPNGVTVPGKGPRPDPGAAGAVLYVANFTQPVANKAFDMLFAAWAQVHGARPDVRLAVAGAGDVRPWREFLRARGAEQSVSFLGRLEDLGGEYQKAAMLVLPSRREGISNALLEAQSWGVPAVVSDIPGNRLVIEPAVNGLVVPAGDAGALAGSILHLLGDDDMRVRLGLAARRRIEADFRMEAIAARVAELYSRIQEAKA